MRNFIRRKFGTASGLPKYVEVAGHGKIPIVLEPLVQEQWGIWDAKRGRIVIKEDLPDAVKHIVLLNQFLLLTKNLLGSTDLDTFIQAAPLLLLHLMTEAGVYKGVDRADVLRYLAAEMDKKRAATA